MGDFADLAARLDDIRPAIGAMVGFQLKRFDEGFLREEDPAGSPWVDLSPRYERTKEGPSILIGTRRRLADIEIEFTRDGAILGPISGVPFTRIQAEGGLAGGGAEIPGRRFVGAIESDATEYSFLFLVHIRGGVV